MKTEARDKLETEFVDKCGGLEDILESLEEIYRLKADHLSVNWQDASGRRVYNDYADQIEKCRLAIFG